MPAASVKSCMRLAACGLAQPCGLGVQVIYEHSAASDPVTRGAGAAPDPPSETHRGHWAGVRAPWAGVRVAFVMTIREGFSNWHKACHFLICTLSSVDRGTRGTQSRSASLLARSTSPGPRSAKRGAARASDDKVHVSYKQHSGETISMFHVEQKVVKKG